jgi:O-antigen ligase
MELGFLFLIAGALLAFWVSTQIVKPPERRPALLQNPLVGLFATGLWVGLMLGGLGILFSRSTAAGLMAVAILVGARLALWFRTRGRGKP